MPQSHTAAKPRHQEEEKKDKNIHAQNKQAHVREAQRPAREDFITLSAQWYKPQSYTELRTTPGPPL